MRIIALEEHYADPKIMAQNGKYLPKMDNTSTKEKGQNDFLMSRAFIGESLTDFKKRIAYMDENHIDVQVLSMTSPVSDKVPKEEAIRLCQEINNITKQHMDEYPGRFLGFASLPMADPVAAASELERSVKELGLSGALIAGKFQGRAYNEKEFWPIYKKASELDVPIYLHPAFIPKEVQKAYYDSDAYSPIVAAELGSAGFGWHVDVGILALRLILSGVFDEYPNLKVIAGHWGETIPAFLERIDSILTKEMTGLKKNVSEYYKGNFYLTPSGILSNDQLEYLVKVMGADHIMYALDYPYVFPKDPYGFLVNSSLSDEEKELIAHKNAERLLKTN